MPAVQFYETRVVDLDSGYAFDILSAPERVEGLGPIDYFQLTEGIQATAIPLDLEADPAWAISRLVGSLLVFDPERPFEDLSKQDVPDDAAVFAADVTELPLIPTETSPLVKRAVVELSGVGGVAGYLIAAAGFPPAVALLIPTVGLIVIRPVIAVAGAFWEGARPHVVKFGGDASEKYLNALRQKFNIGPAGAEATPSDQDAGA